MPNRDFKISAQTDFVLVERPENYEIVPDEEAEELLAMATACREASCRKVLIVGPDTKVKMSVVDILELGRRIAELGLEIAVVESHDASNDDVEFLENVAWNRGGVIQFFDSQTAAREWLGVAEA